MTRLLLSVAVALAVTAFALANRRVVALDTVVAGDVQASLALLLFGAFSCGVAAAALWSIHRALRRRLRERAERERRAASEAELLPAPPYVPRCAKDRAPGRLART